MMLLVAAGCRIGGGEGEADGESETAAEAVPLEAGDRSAPPRVWLRRRSCAGRLGEATRGAMAGWMWQREETKKEARKEQKWNLQIAQTSNDDRRID